MDLQTVRGLWVVLGEMVKNGHGETSLFRADIEAGPCPVNVLELYDTTKEVETGSLPEKLTFVIS